jgi:hypothetical protein
MLLIMLMSEGVHIRVREFDGGEVVAKATGFLLELYEISQRTWSSMIVCSNLGPDMAFALGF